jgi:hypothetical protein
MGTEFSKFIFQASFCTTVTTIVSGKYVKETVVGWFIMFNATFKTMKIKVV